MFRPFPTEGLCDVLRGRKAIGILDRSACLGWNCGHLYMELAAAMGSNSLSVPMLDFIVGLGGLDITLKKIGRAIDLTQKAAIGGVIESVFWIDLE
jgi:pyruvate/2-oxoacid:ferredoxin oxidoreductase alpha subunit